MMTELSPYLTKKSKMDLIRKHVNSDISDKILNGIFDKVIALTDTPHVLLENSKPKRVTSFMDTKSAYKIILYTIDNRFITGLDLSKEEYEFHFSEHIQIQRDNEINKLLQE